MASLSVKLLCNINFLSKPSQLQRYSSFVSSVSYLVFFFFVVCVISELVGKFINTYK